MVKRKDDLSPTQDKPRPAEIDIRDNSTELGGKERSAHIELADVSVIPNARFGEGLDDPIEGVIAGIVAIIVGLIIFCCTGNRAEACLACFGCFKCLIG